MTINKHTLWHNIRTICTGLLIIGLIPLPFVFMGPVNPTSVGQYGLYIFVTLSGVLLGQVMVVKYRQYADMTDVKKKQQTIYGVIGITIILLFVLMIALLPLFS